MSDALSNSYKIERLFFPDNEKSNTLNLLADLRIEAEKIDFNALFKTQVGKQAYDKYEDHMLEAFEWIEKLQKMAEHQKSK